MSFITPLYQNLLNNYTIITENPLIIGTIFLSYVGYQIQSNYEEEKLKR
jgi:hypothetical protein